MTWLYEDIWTVLLVCIAIGVSVEIVCSQLSQQAMLLGALGTLVFSALMLGIEWYVITDYEEVENMLYEAADAVDTGDFSNVRPYLVKRQLPILGQARTWVESYRVRNVNLSNLKITVNKHTAPPSAHVEMWASVDYGGDGANTGGFSGRTARRVKMDLEFEDGRWRVADANVQDK